MTVTLTFDQFKQICRSDFGINPSDDRRAFSQHNGANGAYEFQAPTDHCVTYNPVDGLWTAHFNGATGEGADYQSAWAAVKADEQRRYEAFLASQPAPLGDLLW